MNSQVLVTEDAPTLALLEAVPRDLFNIEMLLGLESVRALEVCKVVLTSGWIKHEDTN